MKHLVHPQGFNRNMESLCSDKQGSWENLKANQDASCCDCSSEVIKEETLKHVPKKTELVKFLEAKCYVCDRSLGKPKPPNKPHNQNHQTSPDQRNEMKLMKRQQITSSNMLN